MNQGGKLGVVEGLLTFNSKKRDLCTSINCHLSRDQLYKVNAIMYGVSDKLNTANFGHINHFIYNKMSFICHQDLPV